MAITATLVEQGQHRLRYLVTAEGTTGLALTITSTGAASPDVLTDTAGTNGVLRKIAKAFTDGYGKLAAGALTQAQARAIWAADDAAGAVAVLGQNQVSRARCKTTTQGTGSDGAFVDVNVDGSGHPTIIVTAPAASTFFLDIEALGVTGAIGT